MSALARSIWPFRIQLINFRPDFEKPRESLHTAIPLVDIVSEESEREEEGGERSSENMTDIQEKQQERDGFSGDEVEGEQELLLPGNSIRKGKCFLVVLTFFSTLGGFLFGYDTGVVSGAMLKVREVFILSAEMQEAVVAVTVAAAALAAIIGGPMSDLVGRKPTLILASVVFTVGSILIGVAWHAWLLLIGRLVVGIGVGLAAMAVPMYLAELAPAKMRGKIVVVNNLGITGGQFVATVVDGAMSYLPYNIGWRLMFGLAIIPSVTMFIGFLFLPESPRWLVFHGKSEKARQVLTKIRPAEEVDPELEDIIKDYEELQLSKMGRLDFVKRFCTSRTVLLALLIGCGLQLFQQFGGINTVMYYSASIIQMAGYSDQRAIWLATIPGFANALFTIVGLILVDRIGRRKLLIGSITGTIFGLGLLAASFELMDHYSPQAVPLYSNGSCDFTSCGACVANSQCGFCANINTLSNVSFNGTCSQGGLYVNGTSYSNFTIDYNGTMVCRVHGEHADVTDTSITATVASFAFGSGSESLIPLQGALQRVWDFNSCPNNKLAPLVIVALFLYIAFFAPGMGPLPWTINSEIYPTWARSTAIAIATSVNWISNLIVSMTFLTLTDHLGQPISFGLYAALGFLGLVFFVFLLPETKGKSLEEVEELFQQPYFTQWCGNRQSNCREVATVT